ncbi:MAG: N-acetyltransferase [Nitrospirae bacterium]|nr:N-acetyltransferase [Candidatus Manganitrophaceae bacterium]
MYQEEIVKYEIGLKEREFSRAARLYDEAFGNLLKLAIPSQSDRVALFETTFFEHFALSAHSGSELVGIAGFHTPDGALTGGISANRLLDRLGIIHGIWATAIFCLYERRPQTGELVMDGIAVHKDYRGRGIGSHLLNDILNYAREKGFKSVRLDVIDTNPGAQRLYERSGFIPVQVDSFPYLRWLLGYGGSTMMVYHIADVTS